MGKRRGCKDLVVAATSMAEERRGVNVRDVAAADFVIARKHRGTIKEKFCKGSGSIARHILKQLESLKIVEKVPSSKGRRITPQGQRDLDSIAGQLELKKSD